MNVFIVRVIAPQPLRIAIASPANVGPGRRDYAVEYGAWFGNVEKLINGIVAEIGPAARVQNLDAHKMIYILVNEGIQDNAIDNAVHSRTAPDCQGKRDGGNDAKDQILREIMAT